MLPKASLKKLQFGSLLSTLSRSITFPCLPSKNGLQISKVKIGESNSKFSARLSRFTSSILMSLKLWSVTYLLWLQKMSVIPMYVTVPSSTGACFPQILKKLKLLSSGIVLKPRTMTNWLINLSFLKSWNRWVMPHRYFRRNQNSCFNVHWLSKE